MSDYSESKNGVTQRDSFAGTAENNRYIAPALRKRLQESSSSPSSGRRYEDKDYDRRYFSFFFEKFYSNKFLGTTNMREEITSSANLIRHVRCPKVMVEMNQFGQRRARSFRPMTISNDVTLQEKGT